MDEFMFDEKKTYNHQESKNLLSKVRVFFQTKLRVIVPEWISPKEKEESSTESYNGFIEVFCINECSEPIYSCCNGFDDIKEILDSFSVKIGNLIDYMDQIIDNNKDLDDITRDALDSYAKALDKSLTVYENQINKRMTKFKELQTVRDLREELYHLFSEIISKYIISVLFDGLYERLKNNSGPVYELVVKEIDAFLASIGVCTRNISIGESIDSEYMEATPDSLENYTDDYKMFDKVSEIRRYPYVFKDGQKIADGVVKIWRRND